MTRCHGFLLLILLFLLQACHPRIAMEPEIISMPFQGNEGFKVEKTRSQKDILIFIDAGHGGEDYGADSKTQPKYYEKNLNLTLARMLKNILDFEGYQTALTRKGDYFISLDKRASDANEAGANLFISVHFNSAPSKEASGIEIYYYRSENNVDRTKESFFLATSILDELIKTSKAKSRGTKSGDFAVIRKTSMPAVLIEAGFLTNESEVESIKDPLYLKKLALGISLGINKYLANHKSADSKYR